MKLGNQNVSQDIGIMGNFPHDSSMWEGYNSNTQGRRKPQQVGEASIEVMGLQRAQLPA